MTFSCRTRGFCPSCHAKRLEEWGEWMREELLLDVRHRQVVFTIPKMLRVFFKFKRRLLGDLCRCGVEEGNPRDTDDPGDRETWQELIHRLTGRDLTLTGAGLIIEITVNLMACNIAVDLHNCRHFPSRPFWRISATRPCPATWSIRAMSGCPWGRT